MALTKQQKKQIIDDLKEDIKKQRIMIFVDFAGLKVKDLFELRKKLKETDAKLSIVKKTLFSIASKDYDLALSKSVKELPGQVALIVGFKDLINPAKVTYNFSLNNQNLKILGGFFERELRKIQEVTTLAQLPTYEELLTKLTCTIRAPLFNFVNVLQGNIKNLVFLLSKIKN